MRDGLRTTRRERVLTSNATKIVILTFSIDPSPTTLLLVYLFQDFPQSQRSVASRAQKAWSSYLSTLERLLCDGVPLESAAGCMAWTAVVHCATLAFAYRRTCFQHLLGVGTAFESQEPGHTRPLPRQKRSEVHLG